MPSPRGQVPDQELPPEISSPARREDMIEQMADTVNGR